ncbi:MAG: CHAD domain-containing protein [Desulfamplus sp.]|nr:CHAD domain-containing protein [Desulfamplus sp.]
MIIDEFKNYYLARESAINKHFISASKNGNENSIHELRVEIKKMRAFLELIKGITPNFDLKRAYTPIKNLFKTAAPIRDAQVLQTMTREYISQIGLDVNLSEYFNILKHQEMIAKRYFFKLCKKFDLSIFKKNWSTIEKTLLIFNKSGKNDSQVNNKDNNEVNRDNNDHSEDNIIEHSKDYILNLFTKLDSLKSKEILEEKDFHDIRIKCKKVRYTLEILSPIVSPKSFNTVNNSLKIVHQPLGQWHDTDVAILLINNILSDQSLKPLFSESSYNDMLKAFKIRKQHFNDLFIEHLKMFSTQLTYSK